MSIQEALITYNRKKYREYIDAHRANVQRAWDRMKTNSECIKIIEKYIAGPAINKTIELIDELVKNHDLSKYDEKEFEPYRKNFYPVSHEEQKENEKDFEKAWIHHYTNNLHHWDWWHKTASEESMPLHYVVEMVCDWEAMSYIAGNSSTIEFWESNKDKIVLGKRQMELTIDLINAI